MSILALFPLLLGAQTPGLEPLKTSITVVENVSADTPGSVSVLDNERLQRTPGLQLDDRLRDVPGFSLFRRSSSLVAHPTTQGVSLRGIGSSGASRTLVLWDGIPLNDPFGGWIYWDRVAPDSLERIEVSRGASTSAFGDRAMGGVVALFSREPSRFHLQSSYEAGNAGTHEVSLGFSNLWSHWAASGSGRALATDGYFLTPADLRGAVDQKAGVKFVAADSRFDFFGRLDRLFLKFDLLAEERRNGTVLQRNSTGLGSLAAHYARESGRNSFSLLGWREQEEFRSTFSAIAAGRNSERLTTRQTVPADSTGGAALWDHSGSAFHSLVGADTARVEGYSREVLFPAGQRIGGGVLLEHGVFAQTDWKTGPAQFFLGLRHDFTGQGSTFLSPHAGFAAGRGPVRVRGSVYRSFRAPTLNELYRDFRVGNAVTQANPALLPEKLFGAEAGLDVRGEATRVSFTLYRNSMTDLITNATLESTPNLIVRQRRNAASALSRGLELNAERRFGPVRAEAGYLFVDSRLASGALVPQVPRHQGSAGLAYAKKGTLVSAGVRGYSLQFEDDTVQTSATLLPGFATVQFVVRQRLAGHLAALVAIENALDRRYLAGLTPTPVLGGPRLWRAGLRWEGRVH